MRQNMLFCREITMEPLMLRQCSPNISQLLANVKCAEAPRLLDRLEMHRGEYIIGAYKLSLFGLRLSSADDALTVDSSVIYIFLT